MKNSFFKRISLLIILFSISCNNAEKNQPVTESGGQLTKGSFGYDLDFLGKHNKRIIVLEDSSAKAKVLVSADFQGRVMTSTATGDSGCSYGWINYNLISSAEKNKQFNPVGGEERFWLGPEGGQYGLYFKGGDSFNINHWQVPAIIDTDSFAVKEAKKTSVSFFKKTTVTNYVGTAFDINIERTISLLSKQQLEEKLQVAIPRDLYFVAYESKNQITNTGNQDWKKENGLLSIWLLGMFTPSVQTTVIIPFEFSKNARSLITDNYFGEIPRERLNVTDSLLFFTCDGKFRSKIGLSPAIAKPVAGSFDSRKNVLTLILFSVEKTGAYVNSKWELQKQPFKGDVVNSYNDGPMADGTQMGPFYEIESSSPATELKKGGTQRYTQVTCHFEGAYSGLKMIAKEILGVDLDAIKK